MASEDEILNKIHNLMWNYFDHSHSSEEEWENCLRRFYLDLKDSGVCELITKLKTEGEK